MVGYQEDSKKMWFSLRERYSAAAKFIKVTVRYMLTVIKDTRQLMHEHIAKWKSCSVKLDYMDVFIDNKLLMKLFLFFFCKQSKSLHCPVFLLF